MPLADQGKGSGDNVRFTELIGDTAVAAGVLVQGEVSGLRGVRIGLDNVDLVGPGERVIGVNESIPDGGAISTEEPEGAPIGAFEPGFEVAAPEIGAATGVVILGLSRMM